MPVTESFKKFQWLAISPNRFNIVFAAVADYKTNNTFCFSN